MHDYFILQQRVVWGVHSTPGAVASGSLYSSSALLTFLFPFFFLLRVYHVFLSYRYGVLQISLGD